MGGRASAEGRSERLWWRPLGGTPAALREWETPIEKSALLQYVDDSDDLEVFRVEGELFADYGRLAV